MQLQTADLRWRGSGWLRQDAGHWPIGQSKLSVEAEAAAAKEEKTSNDSKRVRPRIKELAVTSLTTSGGLTLRGENLLTRASTLFELCRLTAWVLPFVSNARLRNEQKQKRQIGPLTNAALEFWVRKEQHIYYAKEIKKLSDEPGTGVAPSSPIAPCTPYIDDRGLLRLGGRLGRAPIPQSQKHPLLLLPDVGPLVALVLKEAHEGTLHGGPGETIAYVRRKFWITHLRRIVIDAHGRGVGGGG